MAGVRLADAVVQIGSDDKKLEQGLTRTESRMSKWGAFVTGAVAGVGAAVAQKAMEMVHAAVGQIGGVIEAASNIGETVAKVGELFGSARTQIELWAGTAARRLGQSKQEALDAAANFAIFGRSAGLADAELVGFSTGLAELASDLASFNNTTPERAINAIGAALRGEAEPIRAFGVLLDDATLKARALSMGLIEDTKDALTQQQRVLAAQAEIYAQTQTQQGDFARTATGLANLQRIVAALLENVRSSLGNALLPVAERFFGVAADAAERVLPALGAVIDERVVPAVQRLTDWVAGFATADRLVGWVESAIDGFGRFVALLREYGPTVLAVVRETAGMAQVLGGALLTALQDVWAGLQAIGGAIASVFAPALAAGGERLQTLRGGVEGVAGVITLLAERVRSGAEQLAGYIADNGETIRTWVGNIGGFFRGLWEGLVWLVGEFQTRFVPGVQALGERARELVEKWLPPVRDFIVGKVVPAVQAFWESIQRFAAVAGPVLRDWVTRAVGWVKQFIDGIKSGQNAGAAAIMALLRSVVDLGVTIATVVGDVLRWLGSVAAWFAKNEDAKEARAWAQNIGKILLWIVEQVRLVIEWLETLIKVMASVVRGDWQGAMHALGEQLFGTDTSGMGNAVPIYDSNGNRIGWEDASRPEISMRGLGQLGTTTNNTINITVQDAVGNGARVAREIGFTVQDAMRALGAQ